MTDELEFRDSDLRLLEMFCIACGEPLRTGLFQFGDIDKCPACNACVARVCQQTLKEEFDAAPDAVRCRILQYIEANHYWLELYATMTLLPRALPAYDARFLGVFCMACGDMFSMQTGGTCLTCGAPIVPANQDNLRVEYDVADEEVKRKIIVGIQQNRVRLALSAGLSFQVNRLTK